MTDLGDLPSEDEILAALREIEEGLAWTISLNGVSTSQLARRLGVRGARRHGNGAVAYSWSGTMSASLRLAPRLRSMEKRGLIDKQYDRMRHRLVWFSIEDPSDGGRDAGRPARY